MVIDAWVYGVLELSKQEFSEWLKGGTAAEPMAILDQLQHLELSTHEFLGASADDGCVKVRGLLRQQSLQTAERLLKQLFVSATSMGGDGRLWVVFRRGDEMGTELQVTCGASRARELRRAERQEFINSRAASELRSVEAANRRAVSSMETPSPIPTAPQWQLPPMPERPMHPEPTLPSPTVSAAP